MGIVKLMPEQRNGERGTQCTADANIPLWTGMKNMEGEELLFARGGITFLIFLKMLDTLQAKHIRLAGLIMTEIMNLAMSVGKLFNNNTEIRLAIEKSRLMKRP
jgi:hypothetical protein